MKCYLRNCKLFRLIKKPTKDFYYKFFLVFVIFFFLLTYIVVNRITIIDQVDILKSGSSFFAKTATYSVLHLENGEVGFDKNTYEIELLVFSLINEIRIENGVSELEWDPMLAKLSRTHSLDMAENSYINHTNLDGLMPVDRARVLGIRTEIELEDSVLVGVGENIGFMPKGVVRDVGVLLTTNDIASAMVLEWMLSEGHKKNILDESYIFTGIGVAYDGGGNYYLTQNFQ